MPENNYGQIFGQSAMQGLGNLAGSLPSALIGGAFGLASTALNNKYAKEREQLARKENYEYGEKSADAADARTRKLFNDLYSPAAQISLIKDAGLSPSIFAGGNLAGISGQSGAQGTGAAGISPTTFGMPNIDLAQYELAHAQARKANAEADEIQGLNDRGAAHTANLLKQNNLLEAEEAYKRAVTIGQDLDNALKDNTMPFAISMYESQAKTAAHNAEIAASEVVMKAAEAGKAKELVDANLEKIRTETKFVEAEELLTRLNVRLSDADRKKVEEETKQIHNDVWLATQEFWGFCGTAKTKKDLQIAQKKYYDKCAEIADKSFELSKEMQEQANNRSWKDLTASIVFGSIRALNQTATNVWMGLQTIFGGGGAKTEFNVAY